MGNPYVELYAAMFRIGVLGYGGGPSTVPLIRYEAVNCYCWMEDDEFGEVLALGNALPGPITTKIAAYASYDVAGWGGALIAVAATVIPSAAALIAPLNMLQKYQQSQTVKGMTLFVQAVIAAMMLLLTWQNMSESFRTIGAVQFFGIAPASFYPMQIRRVHPALVIVAAFIYGGIVLS